MGSERSENFRTRRVEAADDFSTALAQALLELNEAHTLFVRSEFGRFYADYESGRSQLTSARRSIDVAHTYLARVELLFGDESQG
jgi:hypothetical protein